ncbi:MAG: hypothetical protein AAF928_00980 [Myxococcota bacterium]
MSGAGRVEGGGPFRADQVRPGDRYELDYGHAVYCAPAGGDNARANLVGASVLETDPAVEEAGVDAGYSSHPRNLRAPDVAVGNVPDAPGWIEGVPPLAVEYAGVGKNEPELQRKILNLLNGGTQFVWVVRLLGERRVEVHAPHQPFRIFKPGSVLTAPGILANPVPVEAMFDRTAAHEATLRNLLQRRGYEGLEDVVRKGQEEGRRKGEDQGRAEASRAILLDLLTTRFGEVGDDQRAAIARAPEGDVRGWIRRVVDARTIADVFGPPPG